MAILKPPKHYAWCVIGDFNETIFPTEKQEGRQRLESQMENFRKVLEDNNLYDLGWREDKFTWSNMQMRLLQKKG